MNRNHDDGPRFWVVYQPERSPFASETFAVADEDAGGIIAYFNSEKDADIFRATKEILANV